LAFAFRYVVRANDLTIQKYIKIANHFGGEEAHWKFEWVDGGRAIFLFRTEQAMVAFKVTVWLIGPRV
jgi:hypothetical protein